MVLRSKGTFVWYIARLFSFVLHPKCLIGGLLRHIIAETNESPVLVYNQNETNSTYFDDGDF